MQDFERLEVEWVSFNGLDPAGMVACSSGTAALHLALEALELPPGSRVVVPDYTMVACARAVVLAGLTPMFVDCSADTLLADSAAVCRAWYESLPVLNDYGVVITSHESVRAVMVVHVYGRGVDLGHETYRQLRSNGVKVIEDLAEAHGLLPHPETDAACWSFYRNKVVAGEEGGAVWFRDSERARVARELRCLGFTAAHDYTHRPRGHNYRMSNAHARLILNSAAETNTRGIDLYRWNIVERRRLEVLYQTVVPSEYWQPPRDVPWVYDLRVPSMTAERQKELVAALRAAGVEARHGFKPMTWQPEFFVEADRQPKGWESDRAASEIVYIPLTPGDVTDETVATAGRVLRDVLG